MEEIQQLTDQWGGLHSLAFYLLLLPDSCLWPDMPQNSKNYPCFCNLG